MNNSLQLPEREIIRLRNGVDRYGFSHLLADRMGLTYPPRSFGAWSHGWTFFQPETAEDLGYGAALREMPIVVGSVKEQAVLEAEGFQSVLVGGLPFVYTKTSNTQRMADSLVAFIPHSLDFLQSAKMYEDFLDYVSSIKRDFATAYICIFSHDASNQGLMEAIKKRELQYILGAQPDDANSLTRMRWIFDQFEYVLAADMGSHILYASYCGCKTSFAGPYYSFDTEPWKKHFQTTKLTTSSQRLFAASEETPNRAKFPWFFVEHPRKAVTAKFWAQREIGASSILSNETIATALGWSVSGKVRGVMRAMKLRLARNKI